MHQYTSSVMFGKFGWIDILEPVTLRQKQLLGTSFGFPGGFAWALLASKEALGFVWLPLGFAAFPWESKLPYQG